MYFLLSFGTTLIVGVLCYLLSTLTLIELAFTYYLYENLVKWSFLKAFTNFWTVIVPSNLEIYLLIARIFTTFVFSSSDNYFLFWDCPRFPLLLVLEPGSIVLKTWLCLLYISSKSLLNVFTVLMSSKFNYIPNWL